MTDRLTRRELIRLSTASAVMLSADGTWRRCAAYREIGCVSEADTPWEAQEQLEEQRVRYIIDHVQRGEPIPVPRPPLKSLTTSLDLERLGFARWLVQTEQLSEGK